SSTPASSRPARPRAAPRAPRAARWSCSASERSGGLEHALDADALAVLVTGRPPEVVEGGAAGRVTHEELAAIEVGQERSQVRIGADHVDDRQQRQRALAPGHAAGPSAITLLVIEEPRSPAGGSSVVHVVT